MTNSETNMSHDGEPMAYRTILNPLVWDQIAAAHPSVHTYDPENKQYLDIEDNPVIIDDEKVQKYESRLVNYPLIEEQLDMIYWDQVNGTTVWKDTITKIKADFPVT